MRTLTYYFNGKNPDAEGLQQEVACLSKNLGVEFLVINIDGEPDLELRFGNLTPVILIGPYQLKKTFTINEVEVAIRSTLDRDQQITTTIQKGVSPALHFSKFERFSLWFSKRYTWVITIFLLLYATIPFLAPLLELNGNHKAAKGIYKAYGVLCHQLAFRSYYIGGEQPFYPRELANVSGYQTYEEVTGYSPEDINTARSFLGNQKMGYKIALCERDLAIYYSMALIGILFELSRKKIKPIPFFAWLLVSIIPIALDGISQLPGLAEGWPLWFPIRESTPMLRTVTGLLFGGGTALYMYPLMEESVKETRFQLSRKLEVIQHINKRNTGS